MSVTPSDYYIRRKSLLYFDIEAALHAFEKEEEAWSSLSYLSEEALQELKYKLYREADWLKQGWA
jgi:hypothetical protein